VGTAYVALFNYAYARRNGGTFVLRIEDTDQARYAHQSEERISAALRWLGLDYDEGPDVGGPYGPYRQSERLDLYQRYAGTLVERGHAYPCFCSRERLDEMRKEREAARQPPISYDRLCRSLDPAEARRRIAAGDSHVIRMAVPLEGTTVVVDEIRGRVEFENKNLPVDAVLLKADGFPTYHLANVVDDHLMEITLVCRAEEWLPSAPIHVLLYDMFGWEPPQWAHLPLLRNADKSKISKRKNNTSLEWYRSNGYLPVAMLNFLATNGWSMPDGREQFSLADMVAYFSWDRVVTSGPIFDLTRLTSLNAYYLQRLPLPELRALFMPPVPAGTDRRYLDAIIPLIHERVQRTRGEAIGPQGTPLREAGASFPAYTAFFFAGDDLDYPARLLVPKKLDAAAARALLEVAREVLGRLPVWETRAIEEALRRLAEERGVRAGDLFTPLRVAVTGSTASPPLFETLAVLGPERVFGRLAVAIERLRAA
jgi:glutamyl-tRNA synthetase